MLLFGNSEQAESGGAIVCFSSCRNNRNRAETATFAVDARNLKDNVP